MPWVEKAHTLVHAWYGGQEVGHGIVDVLFGQVNPSGRLSVTFPKSLKHTPSYLTFGKADYDILYGEGVFIGHRFYEAVAREPLFYFGHGLSYTSFHYDHLIVPHVFHPLPEHEMAIMVNVTNVGERAGAEVVQLYVHDPESSLQRPERELKAFSKVYLQPQETKRVSLKLDKYALSVWDEGASKWMAEKGEYEVIIARSSNPRDEISRAHFNLPETFYWSGV